ncbi:MAG: PepSY domain-containing protein [Clostridia bacterium]|nr:PepSY domain-containing protein [Clostridia bacterium]
MKKLFAVLLIAVSVVFTGCVNQQKIIDFIGTDAAKEMVLEATGVDISEAKIISIDLKEKNGTEYYQIVVETPDGKYRFDVDALTGKIIDKKELKDQEKTEKAEQKVEKAEEKAKQKAEKEESKAGKVENNKEKSSVDMSAKKEDNSDENKDMISVADAKEIALKHADLSKSKVSFVKSELDKDDGRQVYDIEFYDEDFVEYDYEIDAYTGKILDFDHDAEHFNNTREIKDKEKENNSDIISSGAAKKIALDHAGFDESEVKFVKRKLSEDDGIRIYEVEFYTDDAEYDYEINAVTGKILDYDYDAEEYDMPKKEKKEKDNNKDKEKNNSKSKNMINETQAKKKAIAQVPGAKMSNIVEFETDYDDGRVEYEGKIYYGNMEYEFEIDGYSGAIRSWDAEEIDDD